MTTKIEWTEETWNVVSGCTRISAGCDHCYIERTPPFRMAHRKFDGSRIGATTGVTLHADRLHRPFSWRKPRRIFVCSLADLFHDDVPDNFIGSVFNTMALTPQHTYQLLTKRPARARALLKKWQQQAEGISGAGASFRCHDMQWAEPEVWPLPNVWLGTSTENQQWADARIPILLDTPAVVRWISAEPLLGPISLAKWLPGACTCHVRPAATAAFNGALHWYGCPARTYRWLDWAVAGGETGPGARPMHPSWARGIRDQCAYASVPFFYKQAGDFAPANVDRYSELLTFTGRDQGCVVELDGRTSVAWSTSGADLRDDGPSETGAIMRRVGKKAAGRLLDGITHDAYPAVVPSCP